MGGVEKFYLGFRSYGQFGAGGGGAREVWGLGLEVQGVEADRLGNSGLLVVP